MQINHVIEMIKKEMTTRPFLVAIDGRCGSGKTTLAAILSEYFKCNVVHMDDFFLQPYQRTEKRLNEVGGNVDIERFEKEVLIPLKKNQCFSYQKYDCKKQQLDEYVEVKPCDLTIVEGSYSMHPKIYGYYDLHLFLEIDKDEQFKRILRRNGEKGAENFINKWIPLEEKYFSGFQIKEKSKYHFILEEINDL